MLPRARVTEIYPFPFGELLTDDQLTAIAVSVEPLLIRLRTRLQTITSPMPFGEGSPLRNAVLLLGQVMPDLFPPSEIERIIAMQPPE